MITVLIVKKETKKILLTNTEGLFWNPCSMFKNGSWESSFHWIEGMEFENLTRKGGVDLTPKFIHAFSIWGGIEEHTVEKNQTNTGQVLRLRGAYE